MSPAEKAALRAAVVAERDAPRLPWDQSAAEAATAFTFTLRGELIALGATVDEVVAFMKAARLPYTEKAWGDGWVACVKEHGKGDATRLGAAVKWAACQPTVTRLFDQASAAAGQQALLVRLYIRSGAN